MKDNAERVEKSGGIAVVNAVMLFISHRNSDEMAVQEKMVAYEYALNNDRMGKGQNADRFPLHFLFVTDSLSQPHRQPDFFS